MTKVLIDGVPLDASKVSLAMSAMVPQSLFMAGNPNIGGVASVGMPSVSSSTALRPLTPLTPFSILIASAVASRYAVPPSGSALAIRSLSFLR